MRGSKVWPEAVESRASSFGNTDWWVVRCAAQPPTGAETDTARAKLCQAYWAPVFHFVRRAGRGFEDAEDLTQEFFARLLSRNSLVSADRNKGKFRSFLLTLLKRFLADQWDRENCQKRGGGAGTISLDGGDTEFRQRLEPVEKLNAETLCERKWALSFFDRAFEDLQREYATKGQERTFEYLKSLVICQSEISYAAVARKIQSSETNVKVTVYRLRQRLRELLEGQIRQSGTPADQVATELHELYLVLSESYQ